MALPVLDALPVLKAVLAMQNTAVLVAPPGAGKTTGVPPALLDEIWCSNQKLILLSPRRLAARAAAAWMAAQLNEPVGETIGYRVRHDTKISARTRIEVVTEGVLTRMILAQPDMPDVAGIVFDECHERSLEGDTALALALDVQAALRPELRLLAMSATLDGARVAKLMNNATVVRSEGRMFPVTTHYLGRDAAASIDWHITGAVHRALAEETGSILCFLPGVADINRTLRVLGDFKGADIHTLYGTMEFADQQRAMAQAAPGTRKIVLATSIAETSLTLEGIRVVIDSGLARRPKFDPASGLMRLVTERVSQAAADQRRGRAGRLEAGVCYRLWDEAELRGLAAFDPPEILNADMAPLVMDLALWGVRDPATLRWLDPPPAPAWAQSVALLKSLEALDADGAITAHGKQLASMALHPRLAHAVMRAGGHGFGDVAAEVAALISDHGLGGNDVDLALRLEQFHRDSSPRARAAKQAAQRWSKQSATAVVPTTLSEVGASIAFAYPDRIAKNKSGRGQFLLASGRAGAIAETDALARAPYLAVAELTGTAAQSRIVAAAWLTERDVRIITAQQITAHEQVRLDSRGGVHAFMVETLGAITLSETPQAKPSAKAIVAALLEMVGTRGIACLPWTDMTRALQQRVQFLHHRNPAWPDLSDATLLATRDAWLAPYLSGKTSFSDFTSDDLRHALLALLPDARALDKLAPTYFETPAATRHTIDYTAQGGPSVACRVQELYGLKAHPMVGGEPLTLLLLSPAQRPVQTTKDLPAFWRGTWQEVKAEMRGRYPRHAWPDDPANAMPTTRTKAKM